MHGIPRNRPRKLRSLMVLAVLVAGAATTMTAAAATQSESTASKLIPKFSDPVAFDTSKPLRDLAKNAKPTQGGLPANRGPVGADRRYSGEEGTNSSWAFSFLSALQATSAPAAATTTTRSAISAPLANFEGISNQDNFNLFGFRVNPPDPVGDVGPNHYVEMVNLAFAVYNKSGTLLLGPVDTGTLWSGFAVPDCTDPSGDPVVLYDQLEDRWLLTQFTTRGPKYYDCVAISQTGDPTGAYYRYAFVTQPDPELPGGTFFPDYPKYGVWTDSYLMTTRDFGDVTGYGISVYALEKNKMLAGNPKARAVQFFLDSNVVPLNLIGDGLLPADIDGTRRPIDRVAAPIVGTQDDGGGYGGTSDALNIFDLVVQWNSKPNASLTFATQLPVAAFDSIFPCAPTSRDCLAQPGITNPAQFLDILSYRQRPTYRLAYRNFGKYEAMVTNQSVEAAPGVAGVRWYEIRRSGFPKPDAYSVYQQGTYSPADGVNRWMGSIAQDKKGNMGLGYSVVNGTTVYPGIRYTGRLAGDALNTMGSVGEGTIINGSGVQRTTNSRWGDYTSMNVDPVDDCTFWYVNEYYTLAGQLSSTAGWQTRIASFKLPGC